MHNEPDYKTAYEVLDRALREAARILQNAHPRTTLRLQAETRALTAEDEADLEEEIAQFNRLHGPHRE